MPFSKFENNKLAGGMLYDLKNIFNAKIGIDSNITKYQTLNLMESSIENGESDAIVYRLASNSQESEDYQYIPLLSYPYVVAVKNSESFINNIERKSSKVYGVCLDSKNINSLRVSKFKFNKF